MGGGIFLFLIVGKSLNFVFQEELENFQEWQKSAIYGGITGAIYKSTRGRRAMLLATGLGALCGSAYSYSWQKGLLKMG